MPLFHSRPTAEEETRKGMKREGMTHSQEPQMGIESAAAAGLTASLHEGDALPTELNNLCYY